MNLVAMMNDIVVGLFGIVLAIAFCNVVWTLRKWVYMASCTVLIFALQGIVYLRADSSGVEGTYPLITHVPLIIVLYFLSKSLFHSIYSVLTAYLCCQLRRWIALVMVWALPEVISQDIAELTVTLPLAYLLIRYTAPSMHFVSQYNKSMQFQFCLVPLIYYVYDYLTRIYTDMLLSDNLVVLEFMQFVCSIAYLMFMFYMVKENRSREYLEQTQVSLRLQVTQAMREISTLREAQQRARAYRHDLRHHLQYLSSCIENGKLQQAQEYILQVDSEIEANKVVTFCNNEAANLIFSAYAERAKEHGIPMEIKAGIPQTIAVSENDLCVLLSNALENALHACRKLKEKGIIGQIEVLAYEKDGKLLMQIVNSCDENVTFANGVPVTNVPGHGMGVRSICALVDRYNGIYTFSAKDGKFILRVCI